jgi:hypothetical protein
MLKKIKKKIRGIAIIGGILGATYGLQFGINHLTSNFEYVDKDYHSVTRADGAFSSTRFDRYDDGNNKIDGVFQFRLFGSTKLMDDYGSDGSVDRIHIVCPEFGGIAGVLKRENDYKKFKDEFDKADRILAETKERFAGYF